MNLERFALGMVSMTAATILLRVSDPKTVLGFVFLLVNWVALLVTGLLLCVTERRA